MKFYTAKQAADELGVSTRTLERWRSEGKFLPANRTAGGHSRYSTKQIENAKQGIYSESTELQELLG